MFMKVYVDVNIVCVCVSIGDHGSNNNIDSSNMNSTSSSKLNCAYACTCVHLSLNVEKEKKFKTTIDKIKSVIEYKMYLVFESQSFSPTIERKFVNSSKRSSDNCGAPAIIFLVASEAVLRVSQLG